MAADIEVIENRTYDELKVGDSASLTRTPTVQDVQLFAAVSGDVNPAHMDPAYARTDIFHRVIVHGMWGGALISSVLGVKLPGPGTIYLDQSLKFSRPVDIGDLITATATVTEKRDHQIVLLDCRCVNQRGEEVISGQAVVKAPTEKVRRPRASVADVRLALHERYRELIARAQGDAPMPAAVAYPCDEATLRAVAEAVSAGLIAPTLVGPPGQIAAAAAAAGLDISAFPIVPAANGGAAAAEATALARSGQVRLLIQGSLRTDTLMESVVAVPDGLRNGRRISHAWVVDVPGYSRPLLITDASINVAPDVEAKRDIIQNAIDLAHAMGIAQPKAAILAAADTVNTRMGSALDAAALCKMADRGQITGGLLDGPMGLDEAVSPAVVREKGIVSPVAGQADILLVPDVEAGALLVKELAFLGGADTAGVVLGAKAPVVLTNPTDDARTRISSCALGVMVARSGDGLADASGCPPAALPDDLSVD